MLRKVPEVDMSKTLVSASTLTPNSSGTTTTFSSPSSSSSRVLSSLGSLGMVAYGMMMPPTTSATMPEPSAVEGTLSPADKWGSLDSLPEEAGICKCNVPKLRSALHSELMTNLAAVKSNLATGKPAALERPPEIESTSSELSGEHYIADQDPRNQVLESMILRRVRTTREFWDHVAKEVAMKLEKGKCSCKPLENLHKELELNLSDDSPSRSGRLQVMGMYVYVMMLMEKKAKKEGKPVPLIPEAVLNVQRRVFACRGDEAVIVGEFRETCSTVGGLQCIFDDKGKSEAVVRDLVNRWHGITDPAAPEPSVKMYVDYMRGMTYKLSEMTDGDDIVICSGLVKAAASHVLQKHMLDREYVLSFVRAFMQPHMRKHEISYCVIKSIAWADDSKTKLTATAHVRVPHDDDYEPRGHSEPLERLAKFDSQFNFGNFKGEPQTIDSLVTRLRTVPLDFSQDDRHHHPLPYGVEQPRSDYVKSLLKIPAKK